MLRSTAVEGMSDIGYGLMGKTEEEQKAYNPLLQGLHGGDEDSYYEAMGNWFCLSVMGYVAAETGYGMVLWAQQAQNVIVAQQQAANEAKEGAGGADSEKVSRIGDFTDLQGSTVDEILDRIPDEATLRELYPVEGGATEGFEFKWVQDGQTYRVRVHNANPGSPEGSYSANGWIVRVQRGKQYYDFTISDFQEAKYTNVKGDFFDEAIMNNTHIPIKDPYD